MVFLTSHWTSDLVAVFIAAVTLLYFYLKRNYSYWERRGIKTLPGWSYFLGHMGSNAPPKQSMSNFSVDLYKSTNEPYEGIYTLLRPVLFVRDPELIRSILIKDFSHFTDRRSEFNADYDPIQAHLFALPGPQWKPLRAKLTPTFTSGKLKAMFSTIVGCGENLQNYLDKLADKGELLDVREVSARNTTNIIASVAFGIEVDTINNPDNDFRKYGRKLFESTPWNAFKRYLLTASPKLFRALRIKALSPDCEKFFISVVKDNLEYREKNNIVRKDFFQLLIQLRNTGTVQLDDEWATTIKGDANQKQMSIEEMTAQAFLFFVAGFETSSTTLSFCLYELAKNAEIQQRVHDEIDRILEAHDGKVTYDSVSEMKYLETCIDETLRKYPILSVLPRVCVKDYQIPGTNQIIEQGTPIFIPVYAMQRDEKYYESPDKFDPDRFNDENSAGKNIVNRPYYPFGDGPRNCIGLRLGKMQTKVGLVLMLQKFRFELEDRLKNKELEIDPKSGLLAPLGGIHLHLFKR